MSILFLIFIVIIQVTVLGQSIAPIFVTLILFHRGVQSAVKIQLAWQQAMQNVGGVEMTLEEFETVANRQELNGNNRLSPLQQGIELHDVSFAYDPEIGNVLHDLNLNIPANATVALVGESGAGKSTLVDLLNLLLRPQQGRILIDNVPGEEVELSSWRSQIGYVSQETVMFDDTIAANISLWSCNDRKDRLCRQKIEAAAHKAYCHPFIKTLPNDYQTIVGDRGIKLSGGQRQRLFIARELFKEPRLLILDEATSSLDTESERYIQKSIDELKGKMTLVIIAHRLSTIKNADYIYVLDHGRIVEEGTYDALVTSHDSKFGKMVAMQSL